MHTFILLYTTFLLFSTIIPNKNPSIFRNMKSAFRLLPHIRLELLIMIQNILSLISMARQDIRNQWLRFRHDKRILIPPPLYLFKILLKNLLPASIHVLLPCRLSEYPRNKTTHDWQLQDQMNPHHKVFFPHQIHGT